MSRKGFSCLPAPLPQRRKPRLQFKDLDGASLSLFYKPFYLLDQIARVFQRLSHRFGNFGPGPDFCSLHRPLDQRQALPQQLEFVGFQIITPPAQARWG